MPELSEGNTARRRRWTKRAMATLTLLFATVVPVQPASADSLVFNRPDGNVYLATPDGATVYQVTRDGTAADRYGAPSQSDNGTIATWRDDKLYVYQQDGKVLASFRPTVIPTNGVILDAAISPDASMIAYTVVYRGAECTPVCTATFVTATSGAADQGVLLASWEYPSWFGDADLAVSTQAIA